jgi:hypothetical protein
MRDLAEDIELADLRNKYVLLSFEKYCGCIIKWCTLQKLSKLWEKIRRAIWKLGLQNTRLLPSPSQ